MYLSVGGAVTSLFLVLLPNGGSPRTAPLGVLRALPSCDRATHPSLLPSPSRPLPSSFGVRIFPEKVAAALLVAAAAAATHTFPRTALGAATVS